MKAYILAGGKSRRFGGDKGRAIFNGQTVLQQQAYFWRSLGHDPVVVASRTEQYHDLDLPVIVDSIPFQGPLSGLITALVDCSFASSEPQCIVSSCDSVFVELAPIATWISAMLQGPMHPHAQSAGVDSAATIRSSDLEETQENSALVAIMETTERQPFPGLYAVRALPRAREVLASQRPSMMGFLERLGSRLSVTPTGEAKWWHPFNTQEELGAIRSQYGWGEDD